MEFQSQSERYHDSARGREWQVEMMEMVVPG